ncbi:FHA domain-containing protein DDL [Morella rubra]|uniref:FHA domain-containing protein DDL n=1 Tax=Morella rubra TaxID=262757 RepID=A0A6A1WM48_9ROSI|nr:FHA domain-containing protein DDL [Morella rubra]
MGRNVSNHSASPVRVRGSPPQRRSPSRKSPSRRERSPTRQRGSQRVSSPSREKHSGHANSPKHSRSGSPAARSPSPRTKRLRRAQAEQEVEKETEREHEKNHGKGSDRGRNRARGSEREAGGEQKERRLGRHDNVIERETEREHEKNHGKGNDKGAYRERGFERETGSERKERRSGRDYNEAERETQREHDRNHGSWGDRGAHRERGSDREIGGDRKGRRLGRDDDDSKSSRSRHERSASPSGHHHRSKRRSPSPLPAPDTRACDEVKHFSGDEDWNNESDSVAKMRVAEEALQAKETQKPSFELSGKLAAETNRVRGVTLLFTEPPDARKPSVRWRLYVFKGGEVLNEPLYIHRQSCYLFGRERRVADIPTDHPSCSKQHAVIQFRQVEKEEPDGTLSKKVRPYVMDLGSTNKTYINDDAVEPQRYYELFEKDTIRFGNSSREYVLLHENSAT